MVYNNSVIRRLRDKILSIVCIFALFGGGILSAFSTTSTINAYADHCNQSDPDAREDCLKNHAITPNTRDENQSILNSIKTDEALGGILGQCQIGDATAGASITSEDANNKLLSCISQVLRVVFIISVFWMVANIAALNLGIIGKFGDGEDPIKQTREAIKKGLIGLFLIGAPILLINLFNSGLGNINFTIRPATTTPATTTPGDINTPQGRAQNILNSNSTAVIPSSEGDFTLLRNNLKDAGSSFNIKPFESNENQIQTIFNAYHRNVIISTGAGLNADNIDEITDDLKNFERVVNINLVKNKSFNSDAISSLTDEIDRLLERDSSNFSNFSPKIGALRNLNNRISN